MSKFIFTSMICIFFYFQISNDENKMRNHFFFNFVCISHKICERNFRQAIFPTFLNNKYTSTDDIFYGKIIVYTKIKQKLKYIKAKTF